MRVERFSNQDRDAPDPLANLLNGRAQAVLQAGQQIETRQELTSLSERVIFPGAFNPLHEAHLRMASVAEDKLRKPVIFEISVKNVDKATLQRDEVESRASQFAHHTICLTQARTFAEKSQIFPGCVFLVGADTIARIGDQRCYDCPLSEACAELAGQNCRFLVFGRVIERQFTTLSDIDLPSVLRQLCEPLSEAEFRLDISSTDLRKQP